MAGEYSRDELAAIYELGRLYYEMGYLTAAERVFNGLSCVDNAQTPARVGIALVKLERGSYDDAVEQFRCALRTPAGELPAKVGLCATLVAMGNVPRAAELLQEIRPEMAQQSPEVARIFEAYCIRCGLA